MRTEDSRGAWLRERGGMVTSRKERKCIDSSSAGRAGIFYCSSWRMVCWLPVPPPAGAEECTTCYFTKKITVLALKRSLFKLSWFSLSSICTVRFPRSGSTCNSTAHTIHFKNQLWRCSLSLHKAAQSYAYSLSNHIIQYTQLYSRLLWKGCRLEVTGCILEGISRGSSKKTSQLTCKMSRSQSCTSLLYIHTYIHKRKQMQTHRYVNTLETQSSWQRQLPWTVYTYSLHPHYTRYAFTCFFVT